jgi:outer membrane lipoprotein-sorting protein
MMIRLIAIVCLLGISELHAQDMTALVKKVKAKLDVVNDYTAEGVMKTDIVFIKAPISKIKVFYKKPNSFKLVKDGGISLLPKGGISVNMSTIIAADDYVALAAGDAVFEGTKVKLVKVIPTDENSNIVLTTLYIDEENLLIRKAVSTTKENGTYDMQLYFGKYAQLGLPDKVIFSFNTKDYKLPKGITLEFQDTKQQSDLDKLKNKKGKVEISYKNYVVNKGIDAAIFKN